jgi:hypothetical protein
LVAEIGIILIVLFSLSSFYASFKNQGNEVNLLAGNPRKPYGTSKQVLIIGLVMLSQVLQEALKKSMQAL